jgi:serine/threonine protein kinase
MVGEDIPTQLTGLRVGSVVAGYRLEAQVGAGGMAVVFRARDERLGRLVALKVLAPGLAADPAFRRRFIAESRAAATVDDPHIIPIYEAGEAGGVLFIAMRFVGGGDLRGVLDRAGVLPPAWAAAFISPVASALDAAHRAGLVHRDVKPANILVDARRDRPDHVYLSDFGVSKGAISSVSLTGAGHFLGTPDYSAPEQIQGREVDGRADQYALACVAYQLLTGVVPFARDQGMSVLFAHLSEPPPALAARRPGLPAAADAVLARGMAKVPEKRYASCTGFADALRQALGLAPYTDPGPLLAPERLPPPVSAPSGFPGFAGTATTGSAPNGAGTLAGSGNPLRTRDAAGIGPTDPAGSGHARSRSPSSRSSRTRRLVPVAAAAVIVAIVVAILATVGNPKHGTGATGAPAPSLAGRVPPYYVWITPGSPGNTPSEAVVRQTVTGAVLGTIKAAAGNGTVVAVTGAADDRTFVLDEQVWAPPTGGQQEYEPHSFYVLRLDADGRPAGVTRLPIKYGAGWGVTGLALSPDGTKLAVAIQPYSQNGYIRTELKLYSVATGAVLRTWDANGIIGPNPDDPEALSWTSDGKTLAFLWAGKGTSALGEWLLNLGLGGNNLIGDSRQAVSLGNASPGPASSRLVCQQDLIITPGGSAIVCGAVVPADLVQNPRTAKSAYLEYSPASGTVTRTLARWTVTNAGALALDVLWSNPSGSVLIGEIPTTGNGAVGMITAGAFTALPGLGPPGIDTTADQGAW